ncbi:MAG: Fe-S protein assembly co-chaperone HscB [Burkholderiales bacterium]|nr:Fe-S protein assembly co-chaperone HscB [Burkholderiales bacterium]
MNSFAEFGIEPTFALDLNALASRYRDLQSAVHPDRFANATDAEQRAAMARAVEVNDAYNTLKDPVRRAMHLLSLKGIDALAASDTSMPVDFLMEQVEWREALADARLKEDTDRLDALGAEIASILRSLGDTFAAAWRGEHLGVATTLARKMRFMQKLGEEVDSALSDLEQ